MSFSVASAVYQPAPDVSGAGHSGSSARANPAQLAKLQKAAGEFESILLQTLWKSMKETFSDEDDPDNQEGDPTLESFDNFGMQAMAGVVGESGGLGIKGLILKHLEPTLITGGRIKTTA